MTESDALVGLSPTTSAVDVSALFQDLAAIDLFAEALPWDTGGDPVDLAVDLGLEPFRARLADVDDKQGDNSKQGTHSVVIERGQPDADPDGADGGYFLVALGPQYVEEAARLVRTLRKAKETRPVAVLVKEPDAAYAEQLNVFHRVVTYDSAGFSDDGLDALAQTNH